VSGLYETDILEWSEHQTELLRRIAQGERLNENPDWANIIEEVESVGRDQLRAVESFLVQAIAHTLKAQAWPASREVPGWHAEARRFQGEAAARYTPSMRQRLDLSKIYRRALRALPSQIDGQPPAPMPPTVAFTLEDLLQDEPQ